MPLFWATTNSNHGILYPCVLVIQSCLTLHDLIDCSLPGSSVRGILQARYWSGLPFPFPRAFPNPGIDLWSPTFRQSLYHLSSPHSVLTFMFTY